MMIFSELTNEDLSQLVNGLRSSRLKPPFSSLLLRRYVPESLAARIATELQRCSDSGLALGHLANCLELLHQDRARRPSIEDLIDLVWTGPEAPGIVNRDTSVVVREMFQSAQESILIVGYAVHQGHLIFKELAERMDTLPDLQVRMYLDIQRHHQDQSPANELAKQFAYRFVHKEWPGRRLPKLFYDPRSLETNHIKRASLHAKCVVVDQNQAFVSSANFTEAAQTKNIEVGVLLKSSSFAKKLADHFDALACCSMMTSLELK